MGADSIPTVDDAAVRIARERRAALRDIPIVGITGSCGKTTTKDLAAGLLTPDLPGFVNPGSGNCGADLVRNLLRAESQHRFFMQELGAWGPGTLDAGLDLVRPNVGVVLNVRRDHYGQFRGLEHTQAEKAKLVACLPPTGTAILNADDDRVWAMRTRTRGRVLGFGTHSRAELRFGAVRGAWPDRLSFDLWFHDVRRRVRTQLIGEHLVGSAVAAIAIAQTLGVSMDDAVERMACLPPTERRMSCVTTDSGIAFVRDDFKAASDSLAELTRFLEQARAMRKVAVIGRISDYPGRSRPVYTRLVQEVSSIVELLVFVGERPENLWGSAVRNAPGFLAELSGGTARVRLFATVREASRFLRTELRAGDLVVLKGSGPSDHLERILLDHQTAVRCWRADCGRVLACDQCERLSQPAEVNDPRPA
jgi:UDP-N-acetylmuramoyl-tripeptide--D-alanyl-D-alanine ligase